MTGEIATFKSATSRPRVLVVSHERSGSHFLMNSLAACYGYAAHAPIILDQGVINFNYFSSDIAKYLVQFEPYKLASIAKSHHSWDFFDQYIEAINNVFVIFYIYRDPRDTMVSFWTFLNQLAWHEGPKTNDCSKFIRSAPSGQMMRYQYHQFESVVHRWKHHVDGWTRHAATRPERRVVLVAYEDLYEHYESVMKSFNRVLETEPYRIVRPRPDNGVVLPSAGGSGRYKAHLDETDVQFIKEVAGDTMHRLGYDVGS